MFFFFADTAAPAVYTLSLHDALPICPSRPGRSVRGGGCRYRPPPVRADDAAAAVDGSGRSAPQRDRKSTRLNSSHVSISYTVFCLKKKNSLVLAGAEAHHARDVLRLQ